MNRYDLIWYPYDSQLEPSPDGAWVPAAEALALQEENERLRSELSEAHHENRSLRRENSDLIMRFVL